MTHMHAVFTNFSHVILFTLTSQVLSYKGVSQLEFKCLLNPLNFLKNIQNMVSM